MSTLARSISWCALALAFGACRPRGETKPPASVAAASASPSSSAAPGPRAPGATPRVAFAAEEVWQTLCVDRSHEPFDTGCMLHAVARLADGTLVFGGGYYGSVSLGDKKLPRQAFESAVLAASDPAGASLWTHPMGTEWHNEIRHIVPIADDLVLVAGTRANGFEVGNVRLPDKRTVKNREFDSESGFAAVYGRDGRVRWARTLEGLATGGDSPDLDTLWRRPVAVSRSARGAWMLVPFASGAVALEVSATGAVLDRLAYMRLPDGATLFDFVAAQTAIDKAGNVYFFQSTHSPASYRLMLHRVGRDGSHWAALLVELPNAAPPIPTHYVALDDDGSATVAVSWNDGRTESLVAKYKPDGALAWHGALWAPMPSLRPGQDVAGIAGLDRDGRDGTLRLSILYRAPFALAGYAMPAPPPLHADDKQDGPRALAVLTLAQATGNVDAMTIVVPNASACFDDYLTRSGGARLFDGDRLYAVGGEAYGYYANDHCPAISGHYMSFLSRHDLKPLH